MVKIFTDCSERTILKFEKLLQEETLNRGRKTIELDLEAEFSSLALDIIGLGVFNYDFGSVTKESPVIKGMPINFVVVFHSLTITCQQATSFLTEGSFMLKHICISYTH